MESQTEHKAEMQVPWGSEESFESDVHRLVPAWRNPHLWYITLIIVALSLWYYYPNIAAFMGWPKPTTEIFYTVHDLHRLLFFIPVLYAVYIFRLKGAIISVLFSTIIFLPRAFLISPYPDPLLRVITFSIAMGIMATSLAGLLNSRTEQKRMIKLYKNSSQFFKTVFNSINDAVAIIDVSDLKIVRANDTFLQQYGLKEEQVIGKTCFEVTHKRSTQCTAPDGICPLRDTLTNGANSLVEHVHYTGDGEVKYMEVSTSPIQDYEGKTYQVVYVTRNITERKKAEITMKQSLLEKETLLKEVHHRVKNNMQVISSLLHLQAGKAKEKDILSMLKDSQNRIQSMALVYNKLYQSQNLASIDMADYIKELSAGLIKSYTASPYRVAASIEPSNVFLSVDMAIPCGLVINELVTNSLKYAFPENRSGQIAISLREIGNQELELVVSDNGVGIPEGFDFVNTSTLGLKLVTNLVQDQLGGKIEMDCSHGTTFKITFRRAKEEK